MEKKPAMKKYEIINKVIAEKAAANALEDARINNETMLFNSALNRGYKSGANWMLEEMGKCMEWVQNMCWYYNESDEMWYSGYDEITEELTTSELIEKYFENNKP